MASHDYWYCLYDPHDGFFGIVSGITNGHVPLAYLLARCCSPPGAMRGLVKILKFGL